MSAPVVPAAEQVVVPVAPATLAGVEEMLDRQRNAVMQQTRAMLVAAVDEVVTRHGTPLAEQLQASLVQTLEEVQRQQMEPFFEKTRETIQKVVNQVTEERLRPLVNELRETLLRTAQELQQKQLDPLLARTRAYLLDVAEEVRKKYTAPLAEQVKKVLLDTLEEMRKTHGQPFLDAARKVVDQINETVREELLKSLGPLLIEPVRIALREHVPAYLDQAGRRILDIVVAAALFCVAAVFISLGGVFGLQVLGVPHWCTYLLVGLVALLFGLVIFLQRSTLWKRLTASLFAQPPTSTKGMPPAP